MVAYLRGHFRYSTWSGPNTSYARNVKLHNLQFPARAVADRAHQLYLLDEPMERVKEIMHAWGRTHGYQYQAVFNGRSAGYIVMLCGDRVRSEYRSVCTLCGQKNYKSTSEAGNVCGGCHQPGRVDRELFDVVTYYSRAIDQRAAFDEWTTQDLKARTSLVWSFDRMVDECIRAFVDFCATHEIVEQEIMVPQTVKVAVPIPPKRHRKELPDVSA